MDEKKTGHQAIDPTLKSEHVLTAATITRHPKASCEAVSCTWDRAEAPSTYNEAVEHAQRTGHGVRLEEVTVTSMNVGPR